MKLPFLLTFLVVAAAACAAPNETARAPQAQAQAQAPSDPPQCDVDNGGLKLPQGFCAQVVHSGVGRARHMAVTPDGRVYIALGQSGGRGAVVGLRDTNGDGRLDEEIRFGDTIGGTGIEVDGEWLYFAPNRSVLRFRLGSALAPAGAPDTVVSGFLEQRAHAAKSIALDGAGNLYVNVGGPSNACQTQDRQAGSPGQDPCPQRELQMGIWRFSLARTKQTQQDGERYATGIRNAVAIAWNRETSALYVVQHGRDMLNVIAPGAYDAEANAELPAEELLRVDRGDDFGHPYCYFDPRQNKRVLAPEYGGNGTEATRCAPFERPLAAYPAHWAPNDLHFYTGAQFPAKYRNGAFIAFHGSWNRAPLPQAGYRVVFQPMSGGNPSGVYEVFADGFTGREQVAQSREAAHRPVGLGIAPDGSLYIIDSVAGKIWRVQWRG